MRVFVSFIIVALSLVPSVAEAEQTCGCEHLSASGRYEASHVVFLGNAIRYLKSDRGPQWTIVRFSPSEAWKGAGGMFTDVLLPTNDGSCSIEILIGHAYMVFATASRDGSLTATVCSGTKPESESSSDLRYLRSLDQSMNRHARFSDVPTDYPYEQSIMALRDAGVIDGYPDGSFRPERPVSRAELTKILDEIVLPNDFISRRLDEFAYTNEDLPFSDVSDRAWYNLPLRRAYRAGIIHGYRDGTFRPAQFVTVAEASKMVVTALSLEQPQLGGVWYERFIKAVADRNAMPKSVTNIQDHMTRGELSEMIWRLLERVENRPSVTSSSLFAPE